MDNILNINTQDPIINDIFEKNIQYTHITGSVNLCVNRCGQEIDDCDEVHLMNMVNNGKILILNKNSGKSNKCKLKKAYDDDVVGEEFSDYDFEKIFITTPSFNKIDGVIYDCEIGLIFSKNDKYNKKKYLVLCILANGVSSNNVENSDLLFYKLTNELLKDIPSFSNKKEINYPPNPIALSSFLPPYGERSFYEYSYKNVKNITYRIFQRPMSISNSVLEMLKDKLTPNELYNKYKRGIESYENPKNDLLIFFKEDIKKNEEQKKEEVDTNEVDTNEVEDVENYDNQEKDIENYETVLEDIEDIEDIDESDENKEKKELELENQELEKNIKKGDIVETATTSRNDKSQIGGINPTLRIYILSLLVIIFQISLYLFLNYIINKPISGYKANIDLMNYLKSKTPKISTFYFIFKSLNILSLLITIILYVSLVVKGTFYDFNDAMLSKTISFKQILVAIISFLMISIFSSISSTILRIFLPSDKYGEISSIDNIMNIDAIILYFTSLSSDTIDEECINNGEFKLSTETEMSGGGFNEFLKSYSLGDSLEENLKNIFGNGMNENIKTLLSILLFSIYVFIVFGLLFSSFNSHDYSIKGDIYGGIITIFVVLYMILIGFLIFVFGFTCFKIFDKISENWDTSTIFKKIISSFRSPAFLVIFGIWLLFLIIVPIVGTKSKTTEAKGFVVFGILFIIFLFLKYIFFLFEPLNYLYQKKYGTTNKLFESAQEAYSKINASPVQENIKLNHINSIFDPTILLNINDTNIDGKIEALNKYLQNNETIPNDIKELIKNKLIEAINNTSNDDNKSKIIQLLKTNKLKLFENKSNNNINNYIKSSLRDRGSNYHLLRGLLGSIGVNSDLLKLLEDTPYTDEEIKRIENIVIEGLTNPNKRSEIIKKLKELHIINRGI